MAANLEHRRQAIAAALRAAMTEPPVEPTAANAAKAAQAQERPARGDQSPLIYGPSRLDGPPAISEHPSLRAALTAQIDWDEVEDLDDGYEQYETPSVPPVETNVAMSSTASMALFGHA